MSEQVEPGPDASAGPPTPHYFRRDIQGLRAVAVALVVLDHAFGWPRGGFIGVDVFFVISGFLITGLLIREYERTGRISIADFYRRRARRILPVASLVTALTVGASFALLSGPRAQSVFQDGLWTSAFGMNIRLIRVGSDYFGSTLPPSPLQHYWSLAVEEQYYVVWPWILLLAAWGTKALHGRGWKATLIMASLLCGGLYVHATIASQETPLAAYYSLTSRAWELLVGAILALAVPHVRAMGTWLRWSLAIVGLVLIAHSAMSLNASSLFPAPGAVPAVIGAALVIGAGIGAPPSFAFWPLTNRASVFGGEISYSLYLWHWPALILVGTVLPGHGRILTAAVVILAVAVSVVSYYLVEMPVRRSRWLEPRVNRRPRARVSIPRMPLVAATGAALVSAAFIGHTWLKEPASLTVWSAGPGPEQPLPSPLPEGEERLELAIEDALEATAWPALQPAWEDLGQAAVPELYDESCVNNWDNIEQRCTYGDSDGTKTAFVIGDSTDVVWLPALGDGLGREGWLVESFGKYGCPSATVAVRSLAQADYPQCADHLEWALTAVETERPELVIFGSAEGYIHNLPSGNTGQEAMAEWTSGLLTSILRIADSTERIVIMSSPPSGEAAVDCASRGSRPEACVTHIQQAWIDTSQAERSAVEQARAQGVNVVYVDTSRWVCSAEGECPAFVDGLVVRSDVNHLTEDFVRFLTPVIVASVLDSSSGG